MSWGNDSSREESWYKCLLEIKAIHDIGPVVDANQGRHWKNNTMHAPDQMRPSSREALDLVERASQDEVIDAESNVSFANRKYILISRVAHK